MKRRLLSGMVSSRRASLALTLGLVAGCGTGFEEAPAGPGPGPGPAVASIKQRFDQIFAEPQRVFEFTPAPPCQGEERDALLEDTTVEQRITCSLTLEPHETIKRPIRFGGASDGVMVDCQDQLRERDDKGNILVRWPDGKTRPGGSISNWGNNVEMLKIRSDVPGAPDGLEVDPETGFYVGDRPENIVVRNCTVEGWVKIAGLQGAGDHALYASHDTDDRDENGYPLYVARARNIAPTNILFDNVTLIGNGATPIYLRHGVTRFTMINSVIRGKSKEDVGVYFDSETTENTILNSTLAVSSDKGLNRGREQIAVDGSSYNFIVGNRISGMDDGGVYVYRNCGEHGIVRYSTPSYNVIVNNQFVYKNYWHKGSKNEYAVYLSSRNGPYSPSTNPYCDHDRRVPGAEPIFNQAGFPTYPIDTNFPKDIDTSYVTDNDNAHDNVVTNNEFLNRSPKEYMKSKSKFYNYTAGNRKVGEFSRDKKACYAPWSFGRVLLHGNTDNVRANIDGESVCFGYTCNNGQLEPLTEQICPDPGRPIDVECRADQDDDGCQTFLSCPLGQTVKWVKAACNLESGTVSDRELAEVLHYDAKVVRPSDKVSDGACYVLGTTVSVGTKPIQVQQSQDIYENGWPVTVPETNGVRTVNIGCKEKDSNGGDCHVRAQFACE